MHALAWNYSHMGITIEKAHSNLRSIINPKHLNLVEIVKPEKHGERSFSCGSLCLAWTTTIANQHDVKISNPNSDWPAIIDMSGVSV